MSETILHVEDDAALGDLVELAFEGFGFRGTTLKAETVEEAGKILERRARDGGTIELIISDMALPDGSGLDVVRRARGIPAWERTPILILSADADPKKVGRAYALGANSYVAKSPPGRSPFEVVKTLYDYWLKDAILPGSAALDRVHQYGSRAVKIRSRHAAIYMRFAELFGDTPSEAAFWLTRALTEANLANLITFVQRQVAGETVPTDMLEELEQSQIEADLGLTAIEREIEERPVTTEAEAYRRMVDLVSLFDVERYARSLSYLLPTRPVATAALRDFLAGYLEDVAGWLDIHAGDPTLHGRAMTLRAKATHLRRLPAIAGGASRSEIVAGR